MKKIFFVSVVGIFALTLTASAQSSTLIRDLKLGDRGEDVRLLQLFLNKDPETRIALSGTGSPGYETDYFGSLTKAAVMKFQQKYRSEVLYPAGLFSPTGYVGFMTRKKLLTMVVTPTTVIDKSVQTTPKPGSPVVTSVSPSKVRPGDKVTVIGQNFTPTGNTVILGESYVTKRFENLSSADGKTLSFTYMPPSIKTMSESELKALPADTLKQIQDPIAAAGVSLSDAAVQYNGVNSEAALDDLIAKQGLSSDKVKFHDFWVGVQNSNGSGQSKGPLVYGLRKFPFDGLAVDAEPLFPIKVSEKVGNLIKRFIPTAHAQVGGGFTSGIVFVCTCSGSLLTFQLDITGGGTGLYAFPPGFLPMAGSGLIAGPWLGGYVIGAGTCTFYVLLACIYIPANLPMNPVGYAL